MISMLSGEQAMSDAKSPSYAATAQERQHPRLPAECAFPTWSPAATPRIC